MTGLTGFASQRNLANPVNHVSKKLCQSLAIAAVICQALALRVGQVLRSFLAPRSRSKARKSRAPFGVPAKLCFVGSPFARWALASALFVATTGCSTIRKIWTSEETQSAIAADVQRLAGTDKLAAKFDAAEERAQLAYAFTWLTAEKQGITETDARDFLAGKTKPEDEAEEAEPVPADVDAVDFALLQWKFGGVDGSKAKLDSPRVADLRASDSSIRYTWKTGLSGWGLANADAGALACLFVERSDGSIVGGKFDWVSTSRSSRGLENVFGGYNGWSLEGVPNPTRICFVVLSADGRKRSNVVSAEWSR